MFEIGISIGARLIIDRIDNFDVNNLKLDKTTKKSKL